MVIVRIFGGLGNQMFQYAVGRVLSERLDCEFKLDVSSFDRYDMHHGFELARYAISAELATPDEIANLAGSSNRIAYFLRRRFGFGKSTHYTQVGDGFDSGVFNCPLPVYLDGYWQSYRYFEDLAGTIREELSCRTPFSGRNLDLSRIIERSPSVSVHIRRGDYADDPATRKVHGLVGKDYYDHALGIMERRIPGARYFVFSDDIPWVQNNLSFPGEVSFVSHNQGLASFEDMRLMSLCDHHIIANSSFSWWGAWLDGKDQGEVLYPSRWFSDIARDTSSLCPPDWVPIGLPNEGDIVGRGQ